MKPKESKACEACGKPFTNRKSWKQRGQWETVRYCSDRCRAAAKQRKGE